MNTTIAKIIALELGILIAILTIMAWRGEPGAKMDTASQLRELPDDSFATVAPVYQPGKQRLRAVDYLVDEETAPQRQEEPDQTVAAYDQEIVTERYVSSGLESYPVGADPANSIGVYPEPVLDELGCSTLYPISAYSQPTQIIVVSNSRSFGQRHRLMSRPRSGRRMVAQRPPRARQSRPRTGQFVSPRNPAPRPGGVMPRRTANARPSQAGQLNRTRWNR